MTPEHTRIVAAAAMLLASLAAQPAAPEPSPSADPAQVLQDLRAAGKLGEVEVTGSAEVTPGFDPNGTPGDSNGTENGTELDPYLDLAVVSNHTLQCDAVDDQGNLGHCPNGIEDIAEDEDELTPADVEALILEAFQSLPVEASPITYQPDGDWAAVNMDFIVYTDTDQQLLDTTILDIPVTFRLTPSHWTWDFGDGSPAVPASRPGAPYPNHTISHVYSSASDGVTVTLTTLWSGQFQIAGTGDWYPVNGFVTTTATAGPVEIVAFDVHLVPNQN